MGNREAASEGRRIRKVVQLHLSGGADRTNGRSCESSGVSPACTLLRARRHCSRGFFLGPRKKERFPCPLSCITVFGLASIASLPVSFPALRPVFGPGPSPGHPSNTGH